MASANSLLLRNRQVSPSRSAYYMLEADGNSSEFPPENFDSDSPKSSMADSVLSTMFALGVVALVLWTVYRAVLGVLHG